MDTTTLWSLSLIALLAVLVPLALAALGQLFGPRKPSEEKHGVYECGIQPEIDAKRRFSVKFYQVAVLFVVFDVEVAFLFPWAVLYRQKVDDGIGFLISMLVFLAILGVGLYYIIKRGALEWE